GDSVNEGRALYQLSHHMRCTGQRATDALDVGHQAVAMLEQLPPGRELAMAYGNVAFLCMNAEDAVGTTAYGRRALDLAEQVGDVEVRAHTLNTLGTMELLEGTPEGIAKLEASLELALRAGLEEQVGRAYLNMGWAATRSRSYAGTAQHLQPGLEYCN